MIAAEKKSGMATVWKNLVKHIEVTKEKEHLVCGKVVDLAAEDSTAEASVASMDEAKSVINCAELFEVAALSAGQVAEKVHEFSDMTVDQQRTEMQIEYY